MITPDFLSEASEREGENGWLVNHVMEGEGH